MRLNELNKMTQINNSTGKMPVLFLGHGSPMNAIEENEFVKGIRNVGRNIPRPSAIICISAHWETKGTFVTAMEKPPTIHDFGGFPRELFAVQYPAPGSPEVANAIKTTVENTVIGLHENWGLDHGCWSVIRHLYPEADVPVVQLSLDYSRPPQYHYELAKELAPLRKKGILIAGSGNIVHNLRMIAWDHLNSSEYGYDWALDANSRMKEFILKGDHKSLINYHSQGKSFDLSIPTPEHFIPMIYALALREENENLEIFNDKTVAGSLSMTSFIIGQE
jgi:4,5-DOPA dioxygenase extradiol